MKQNVDDRLSEPTGLYPVTSKFVRDEGEKLRRDKIDPWALLHSGKAMRVVDFYGKEISYFGVGFEGSPRTVFWGRYIEPFLEDIVLRTFDRVLTLCKDEGHEAESALAEAGLLLERVVQVTYEAMAVIDQRLRGQGYPKRVSRRNVEGETAAMNRFIDERLSGLIAVTRRGIMRQVMSEDETELRILRSYVEQHKMAEIADPERANKCARELDMREVLAVITGESGAELEYAARLWHGRLASQHPKFNGPLRPCSNSQINKTEHRYHARAYTDAGKAPAWERIRDLETRQPVPVRVERELEQKFKILYSHPQMQRDFDRWRSEGADVTGFYVGVIFLDVDDFKKLNSRFTESVVDRTLLPDFQRLVAGFCLHRGAAYRYGGEEVVILLPNCPLDEAAAFANRIREQIVAKVFRVERDIVQVTVSVGVAAWPHHGDELGMVIERANREERRAKEQGKDRVSVAAV